MVSFKPSATGRIRNRISIAAPTEVHAQRYAPATLPNIASGTGLPAFFFFHARRLMAMSATQTHEPTTTSTTPR